MAYDLEVDNSRTFDPLALQTFANIQKEATDQYNTTMAAYGELESKAALLEKLANDVQGKDSVAYQNYMNYANALRQHTDLLASQGLNPQLMKNLMRAKSDYSRIIHPIEEAWQARETEAKRQSAYLQQHPEAVFERDAYNMGIDQWMKNPHYQAKSVDLKEIERIAKERYAAINQKLQQFVSEAQAGGLDPATATANDVKQWCKVNNVPELYQAIEKWGANPDDVRALLSGDPRMQNSLLQHIADDTFEMTGMNSWNTDYDHYTDAQNQQVRTNLFNRAKRGAIEGSATHAIGKDTFDKHTDDITWRKALEWAKLRENQRQFNETMNWNKDPNNPRNQASSESGGGSKKTGSLTVERDNFIYNGMTRDKANEAVIQSRLPEKYRNESMFRVIESLGLTEGIVDGTINLQDPKVMEKIEKAYNEGKGDIGWLEAKWEGIKNLAKLGINTGLTTAKAGLATLTLPTQAIALGAEGIGRMIFNGESAGDAFSNTWVANRYKNFGTETPFEWGESAKNMQLFSDYGKMGKNDKITVETENGPVEMDKHQFSTYIMQQTGLDKRDLEALEKFDKEVGYDPKDKDVSKDFVYSYAVMNGARNAGDWRLNTVNSEAQNSINQVLREHSVLAIDGATGLKKRAGTSDTFDNLDANDIELINKENLGLMTHLFNDKGTIKNEIVVSAGKDEGGNDLYYTMELPKQGREAIKADLDAGLKYYNLASDLTSLKNMSDREWKNLQSEYMELYNHEHHIGQNNPFDPENYDNTVSIGAIGLSNQMGNIYMRNKDWNTMSNKERDLLIRAYMADEVSKAYQNNALLGTISQLTEGKADNDATYENARRLVKNGYVNFTRTYNN